MARAPKNDPDFPQVATLAVIIAMGVLVIAKLLFWNDTVTITVQGGEGEFDAAGALAYGQRIAQISEMTIATVLTLGAAVLGLNWYTSKRNFEDERTRIADYESRTTEDLRRTQNDRLSEFESILSQTATSIEEIASSSQSRFDELDTLLQGNANQLTLSLSTTFKLFIFSTGIITRRLNNLLALLLSYLATISDLPADQVTKVQISKEMIRYTINVFSHVGTDDISPAVAREDLQYVTIGISRIVDELDDPDLRTDWNQFLNRISDSFDQRATEA